MTNIRQAKAPARKKTTATRSTRPATRSSKYSRTSHPHHSVPPYVPVRVVSAYVRLTAEHFGITPAKLLSMKSPGGGPPGTQPIQRHVAIYLLRRGTGIHLDLLAMRFNRSRTTIIRSLATVERKLLSRSKQYVEAVELIQIALERQGVARKCDRCAIACTPGPLCWECDEAVGHPNTNGHHKMNGNAIKSTAPVVGGDKVLTPSNTATKFGSGRKGGAERT